MASIPITITGVLTYSGLEVGGGPMPGGPPLGMWGPIYYPDQGLPRPQPPRPPLGMWGPIGNYPDAGFPSPQPGGPVYPSHPIYLPPTGIWGGGGVGNYPDAGFPSPQPPYPPKPWGPINVPDQSLPGPQPPFTPPVTPPTVPSDPNWNWAWSPGVGWHPAYVPGGGKPQPPTSPGGGPIGGGDTAPPQAGTLPSTPVAQPTE